VFGPLDIPPARRVGCLSAVKGEEEGRAPDENIIERKLAAGVLPDRPPVKYWAGFGVGQPCDGCDEPILDTQVEYEVAFDAFPTVRLHAVCTEIWGGLVAHAGPPAAGGA
jgi:hypothetical protein